MKRNSFYPISYPGDELLRRYAPGETVAYNDGTIAEESRQPGENVIVSGLFSSYAPGVNPMAGGSNIPDKVVFYTESGTMYYIESESGESGGTFFRARKRGGKIVGGFIDPSKYVTGVEEGVYPDPIRVTVGERFVLPGVIDTSPVTSMAVVYKTRRGTPLSPEQELSLPDNPFDIARDLIDTLRSKEGNNKRQLGRVAARCQ